MQKWGERPIEIASLFNPVFCSVILREAINGFESEQSEGMAYPLVFLVLPIVLHKTTRDNIPNILTTKMHSWINKNRELKIEFPDRVRNFNMITREGLLYGLQANLFSINDHGRFKVSNRKIKNTWMLDSEPSKCSKKAGFVGRWLAQAGDTKTIFHMWGIKP